MKTLYLDCSSGISGDMSIGAFLDLGVDPEYLKSELSKLHVHGYRLEINKKTARGITGTDFDVIMEEHSHEYDHSDHEHSDHDHTDHDHSDDDHSDQGHTDHDHSDHEHSSWGQIHHIIEESSLSDSVKALAIRIFKRVAEAEAKVHGMPVEEVHFHEVGAIDSIMDIVGFVVCFDSIKPDHVIVSPMNTGSGTFKCRHGILSIPAPATSEILAQKKALIYSSGIQGELITPTGAAIACEIADSFGPMPLMQIEKIAYGTGKKDFGIPNVLKLILGTTDEKPQDNVIVLEANIDDMTGEVAGYALERIMAAGAIDAFYTPIFMKKSRPAVKLTVLVKPEAVQAIERLILAETTTIGIRRYPVERTVMSRTFRTVKLPYGEVTVKICEYDGIKKVSPEYESVKELALKTGKPLISIYRDISQE